jgi:prolyl 4-hydroxylase
MYKQEHAKSLRNVVEYLLNPVNAFLLIKRLTRDWNDIEDLLIGDVKIYQTVEDMKRESKFPDEQDLQGAAVALTRLQDVYRLDISDVSRGVLNGVHYG